MSGAELDRGSTVRRGGRAAAVVVAAVVMVGVLIVTTAHVAIARATQPLDPSRARALVAPLYDALNAPRTKDVPALLAKVGGPDWVSCANRDACVSRAVNARNIAALGRMVPDLAWRVVSVTASGRQVTVRSEVSGTPEGTFFGVPASGRSFHILSIDTHEVSNGRVVRSYHVEDWAGAMRQVKGETG